MFLGCQRDDFSTQSSGVKHSTGTLVQINNRSYTDLKEDRKFRVAMKAVSKQEGVIGQSKTVMEERYGFTIDSTLVKELSTADMVSYTMLIHREEEDSGFFENLVVETSVNGAVRAYIIKYTLHTTPTYNAAHEAMSIEAMAELTYIDYNLAEAKLASGCSYVFITFCNWGIEGTHMAGEGCTEDYKWTERFVVCSGGTDGDGLPEDGSVITGGGAGGGTNYGDGTPDPDDGDDALYTTPLTAREVMINNIKTCMLELEAGTTSNMEIFNWFETTDFMDLKAVANYFNGSVGSAPDGSLYIGGYDRCGTPEAIAFVKTAIQAMSENPELSFEEVLEEEMLISNNPYLDLEEDLFSVNNLDHECAKNIIVEEIIGNISVGTNAGFINQIRNTFSSDSDVTLSFRNDDIPINLNANAATDFDTNNNINSGQYEIFITLDNDYLNNNPTKLSIALTVIHEMVHAQLMYEFLHGSLLTEYPEYVSLNTAMQNFLNDRSQINGEALNDQMHLAMVDFIGAMAYSLFKYAQNTGMDNITHQYCKNIVKGSFYGTPAMQNIDTGSNTAEDLRNQTYNEQDNTEEAHGDDC